MPRVVSTPLGRWSENSRESGANTLANRDFKELLLAFTDAEVRFLIIGAYAVMFYTVPRYTKDIDLWIDPSPDNAGRAYRALAKFGAPLQDLSVDDLSTAGTIFQIGVEPNRIDILTAPLGLDFDSAWASRVTSTYDGVPTNLLALEDLKKSKRASGRPQDLLDLDLLERAKPEG